MKSIVVANWKMNPQTMREAKRLFEATRKAAESAKNVSVIVASPSIFLRELRTNYKGRRISLAAQNAHFQKEGAYTGEISMVQVKDSKASAVLIGHAERRAMGETNEETRAKLNAALTQKLQPIFCVGEHKRSGSGEHFLFVKEQLRTGLADVVTGNLGRIIVAYEPVWAIGADKPMSSRQMHEMAIFIRKTLVGSHGEKGMKTKILYGGSIDETNAREMIVEGDVQGLLVGRASTEADQFTVLIRSLA
ncbi:MAG TPA: triose-phosphate isomerase [Candidatus Paceibacterota bacterium]|jgi:triosephosphate isomerase|nr:triose-phosphate isomerase [Candidatus Paceibacterota bacterium]